MPFIYRIRRSNSDRTTLRRFGMRPRPVTSDATVATEPATPAPDDNAYTGLPYADVQQAAKARGISAGGTREAIVERLIEDDEAGASGPDEADDQ